MADLKRNKVFDLLGAVPTNPRWSWCATSPDHKLAVFTLWEDEIVNGRNRLSWDDYQVLSRNGEADQKRTLELVMTKDIPAYGLICIARDPSATPRSIKEVRPDYLMRLKVVKDSGGVWGIHTGKILLAEVVKNLGRLKHISTNGLMDLGHPPDGNDAPDRALSVGYTVVRDDKVRAYVIQRAESCCEYCGHKGFLMPNDRHYLEAHHIIALANQGRDTVDNVIALCPAHHREAHYGTEAESLEVQFIEIVRKKQYRTEEASASERVFYHVKDQ
jgi:5-methylcytosine-specific restriction protein A